MDELNKIINKALLSEVKNRITSKKYGVYHIMSNGEPIDTCENEDLANKRIAEYKSRYKDKDIKCEFKEYDSYGHMVDSLDEMVDMMEEQTKKRVLRLSETEFKTLINRMVSESVPGLETYKKAHDESGKINKKNQTDVSTKIAKYTKTNIDFPQQNQDGEKVADLNTDEEDETVALNRGGTFLDLDYETEPSEKYKDRQKKALEGDSTMGNGTKDSANIILSNVGEKMGKVAEKKKKEKENIPMYDKDPQPVKVVNESVNNDIKKIKKIYTYNEKTQ